MIIGTVIFMILERVIMTWYYHSKIGLQMFRYYKEIAPLFIMAFVLIVTTNYLSQFLPSLSVKYLIVRGVVYSCLYVALFWFILTNNEKVLVHSTIEKVKSKIVRK